METLSNVQACAEAEAEARRERGGRQTQRAGRGGGYWCSARPLTAEQAWSSLNSCYGRFRAPNKERVYHVRARRLVSYARRVILD